MRTLIQAIAPEARCLGSTYKKIVFVKHSRSLSLDSLIALNILYYLKKYSYLGLLMKGKKFLRTLYVEEHNESCPQYVVRISDISSESLRVWLDHGLFIWSEKATYDG